MIMREKMKCENTLNTIVTLCGLTTIWQTKLNELAADTMRVMAANEISETDEAMAMVGQMLDLRTRAHESLTSLIEKLEKILETLRESAEALESE
jgi:hypothetical protein